MSVRRNTEKPESFFGIEDIEPHKAIETKPSADDEPNHSPSCDCERCSRPGSGDRVPETRKPMAVRRCFHVRKRRRCLLPELHDGHHIDIDGNVWTGR